MSANYFKRSWTTQKQLQSRMVASSRYIVSDPKQFMDTLALSYNNLSQQLKACYLYFGAFLEDYEIPVRKLIWLWIAKGLICQIGTKSLDDVAEDYLMDLHNRGC